MMFVRSTVSALAELGLATRGVTELVSSLGVPDLGELFQGSEGEGRRPEEIRHNHTFSIYMSVIINMT